MKAEINQENKAKFFAQYWGQNLHTDEVWENKQGLFRVDPENVYGWLLLKPLSAITDEDAIEVAKLLGWDEFQGDSAVHYAKASLFDAIRDVATYQYLQSKGYALPFMGLSVDEMVQAGWIKLVK